MKKSKIPYRRVSWRAFAAFSFEFIVLFAHPYIGRWTNESQILMLLILAAIAIVLVPLHHGLEKWMKERLATTPKEKLQSEVAQIQVNES
jgi:Mn2+/Fe2+ NRAMP family transporter